jgi:uncharacterized BrkB/YihY/UPF0761 family membrane protein
MMRLVLLSLIFIAGHLDHWKQDLAPVWFWLSRSQLLLYCALAIVALAGMAVALAYGHDKNLKRWSWLFQGTVLLVFVESFVRELIRFYSEVRTSRLSRGLALTTLDLLILAAVLHYRRQKQHQRVGQNSPEPSTPQDQNKLTADYCAVK